MPRKKLSTKPIRIDVPEVPSQSTSGTQDPDKKQDSVKPDSSLQESNKPEVSKPDSSLQESTHQDSSKPEACRQDYSSPESDQLESSKLETSKQDFSLSESNQLESSQPETSKQEFSKVEISKLDSRSPESNQPETTKLDFDLPESNQPESSLTETEYKKVAMRLSVQAAEHLRQFRSDTGIPYEILVDVMVRNWNKLPERTRTAYLKQAQQLRSQRLLAGQEKTMRTLQQKYQQHL